jgi:predicted RNase H-like HicB family nuclease
MCQDDNQPIEVPLQVAAEPDGTFVVTSPLLPELRARGKTAQQAILQANVDIPSILNRYEREGKPLPPQFR